MKDNEKLYMMNFFHAVAKNDAGGRRYTDMSLTSA